MDHFSNKTITKVIKIPKEQAEELQKFLDSNGREEGECGTIETFIADFGNSTEIDIKVCKGYPPFVDAVLFINNCDEGCLDVTDTLIGEYDFGDKIVKLEIE